MDNDPIPYEFRHIHTSVRWVRYDVYMTMAELNANGFSYHKSQIAIMIVRNIHFKRNWKLPVVSAELEPDLSKDNEGEVIDVIWYNKTLPTK